MNSDSVNTFSNTSFLPLILRMSESSPSMTSPFLLSGSREIDNRYTERHFLVALSEGFSISTLFFVGHVVFCILIRKLHTFKLLRMFLCFTERKFPKLTHVCQVQFVAYTLTYQMNIPVHLPNFEIKP